MLSRSDTNSVSSGRTRALHPRRGTHVTTMVTVPSSCSPVNTGSGRQRAVTLT